MVSLPPDAAADGPGGLARPRAVDDDARLAMRTLDLWRRNLSQEPVGA